MIFEKQLMVVWKIWFLLASFKFQRNNLQDHKANESHDFAVRDDFQVFQKTLQENVPAKHLSNFTSETKTEK